MRLAEIGELAPEEFAHLDSLARQHVQNRAGDRPWTEAELDAWYHRHGFLAAR